MFLLNLCSNFDICSTSESADKHSRPSNLKQLGGSSVGFRWRNGGRLCGEVHPRACIRAEGQRAVESNDGNGSFGEASSHRAANHSQTLCILRVGHSPERTLLHFLRPGGLVLPKGGSDGRKKICHRWYISQRYKPFVYKSKFLPLLYNSDGFAPCKSCTFASFCRTI